MQSNDGKKKGKKGEVTVFSFQGRLKVNLPRQYFGGKQEKKSLGLDDTPENWVKAERIAQRMTMDFQDGCFDLTLEKYGIKQHLKLVRPEVTASSEPPQRPELSILEVWEIYLEYKKPDLAITTYRRHWCCTYTNFIKDAIAAVGENPIAMRGWMLDNRNPKMTKDVLSNLSHAYKLAMSQGLASINAFEGLSTSISKEKRVKQIFQGEPNHEDEGLLDRACAFTWEEANNILEYVASTRRVSHLYNYLKFKFLTGCRTGEASGLFWRDIKWESGCIFFNRSYDGDTKVFKPTKNETARKFPMPKGGELWNLLKSIPEGSPDEIVFKSKRGNPIDASVLATTWRGASGNLGIIPPLIEQGKVSKYLPPYNTRHTFINHQINDVGIPPHIVNAWCEHSEEVSKKHYRQLDLRIVPGYGEKREVEKSEAELLREQIEALTKRLDELGK